jgi:hypothetical protein
MLGPPARGHRVNSTVTAREQFSGASGGAPAGTEGEAVCAPTTRRRRAVNVISASPSGNKGRLATQRGVAGATVTRSTLPGRSGN